MRRVVVMMMAMVMRVVMAVLTMRVAVIMTMMMLAMVVIVVIVTVVIVIVVIVTVVVIVVIVTVVVIVVMMVIVMAGGRGRRSAGAFRFERRLDFGEPRAKATQPFLGRRIAPQPHTLVENLRRHVTIAERPGQPCQCSGIGHACLDQRLRL